ncbi:MAG TPA: hypothetical protein VFR20_08035 [Burkholderiaceae bacterium]|nr:hypothetical protein [Burkholderiaceae bacterium]
MRKPLLCLGVVVLAGCAAPHGLTRYVDLHSEDHLRAQRHILMDFPKIQMALFEHQRACGSAPVFTRSSKDPSYAMITQKLSPGADWKNTIEVDLALLGDLTVQAKAYTYHAGLEAQIDQVFNAIAKPKVCAERKKAG